MTIAEVLDPDCIRLDLKAAGKAKVLEGLAQCLAERTRLDATAIAKAILQREQLGSTGFGGGVAVPHARLKGLSHPAACFARLARPVDFAAVDDRPVDLVFMLLTPEGGESGHLSILAQVSRLLRNPAACASVRQAASGAEIHRLLTEPGERN